MLRTYMHMSVSFETLTVYLPYSLQLISLHLLILALSIALRMYKSIYLHMILHVSDVGIYTEI